MIIFPAFFQNLKMMNTFLLKIRVVIFFIFLSDIFVFSQKKYEFSIGMGFPDLIYLKMKYGVVLQTGMSIGFLPVEAGLWTTALDFSYHLPKEVENKTLRTWYLSSGSISLYSFEKAVRWKNGYYEEYRHLDG